MLVELPHRRILGFCSVPIQRQMKYRSEGHIASVRCDRAARCESEQKNTPASLGLGPRLAVREHRCRELSEPDKQLLDHGSRASQTGVTPLPVLWAALDMHSHESPEPWYEPNDG